MEWCSQTGALMTLVTCSDLRSECAALFRLSLQGSAPCLQDRVVIPAEELGWLRKGATVEGRVEWCSHKGALVALVKDPRITS